MQAHTNADDAGRYRSAQEVAAWVSRDPLSRLETYLRAAGLLTEGAERAAAEAADGMAARMRDGLNRDLTPDFHDLFDHVYARRTPQLDEQAALVADELDREDAR